MDKTKPRKGQKVENKCWVCGHATMTVYSVSGNDKDWMAWCRCPQCKAVDDIFYYGSYAELDKKDPK